MSDPLLRELDHYVVLEPAAGERILTAAETLGWLEEQLAALAEVPADLRDLQSRTAQAERLLDTACQLEIEPGRSVQWFAVRLEPPGQA
ncbi:MAG: chlororespiratory reduction protein 7 [Synechococcaceae cyanobacterium]